MITDNVAIHYPLSVVFGKGGEISEKSEENNGKGGRKGMGDTLFRAGIRNGVETLNEDIEGNGVGHVDLHA